MPSDVTGLAGDGLGGVAEDGRRSRPGRSPRSSGGGSRATCWRSSPRWACRPGPSSTADTPRRFLRAIFDATSGYEGDEKLVTAFPTECHGGPDCRISQVVEGPIPFFSLCEHHSLPFFGRAYVGYIAHEHILGLSKLTRLVRLFARRFTVQERIGQQLADALERILAPHGVAVHLEAVHLCTQMRGVREIESSTRTTYWRGNYDTDPELRAEFFGLCSHRG